MAGRFLEPLFSPYDQWHPALHAGADCAMVDHNARLRVSTARTVFNGNLTLGTSPYTWAEKVSATNASSTFDTANVNMRMSVTGAGGYVIRKTREAFNYQAGKPQIMLATGILPRAPGITARIGMFSGSYTTPHAPTDGVYFMTHNNEAFVVICKGGVETAVAQKDWCIDRLDGTGPSGFTLDFADVQLFVIDYEWLGVGPVRFGFQINGIMIYCHIFFTSNIKSTVYMRNCTQPVRYEIRSTGGSAVMISQCAAVMQDGGEQNFGIVGCGDTDGTAVSIAQGATRFIVAARLNPETANHQLQVVSTYLYNSAANSTIQYFLQWNPTFTTPPTWVQFPAAALQIAYGSVTSSLVTGGFPMSSGFTSTKEERSIAYSNQTTLGLGVDVDGNADVIAVCCKAIVGAATVYGGMQMRQLL